jgi:hypothetical protein
VPGEKSWKDMTKEERLASRQAQKEQKMKEREARAKMTPEQRKAEMEARKAEALASREERKTKATKAAETTRKAHAIFAAILDPVAPKAVTFPLSEEDEILFSASRSGCECAPMNAGRDAH